MPGLSSKEYRLGTEWGQDYRTDIDGLRAIAVLAVVLYHAGLPGFSGGFVGVDIFFVISGYLITGVILKDACRNRFSLKDFYVRRIKRILPALFFVLLASSVIAYFTLIPSDLDQYGQSLLVTALFFANFKLNKDVNYFDGPAIEKPLLHTWSLSVEEQFYIFWPLVLAGLVRLAPARRLLPAIATLAALSLILAEARMPDHQKDAFYLPWCRAWELFAGAAIAASPPLFSPGLRASCASIAGLIGLIAAIALYDSSIRFPGLTAALPCAGAAILIAAGGPGNPVSRILSLEPVRFVGLISYSLYLIHWPLFSFAHMLAGGELTVEECFAILVAAFALAYLSWRFIETPFRKSRTTTFAILASTASATALCCAAGVIFWLNRGFPARVSPEVSTTQALAKEGYPGCRAAGVRVSEASLRCELGTNKGANYDFILWGDSHAVHFAPAIDILAKSSGLSGVLVSHWACPPFLDDSRKSESCSRFNNEVASWLTGNRIKFVILGGRWLNYSKAIKRDLARRDRVEPPAAISSTLAFAQKGNIGVVILDQVPDFPSNVSLCIARAIMHGQSQEKCIRQPKVRFLSRHKLLDDYFNFISSGNAVSIASAANALCDETECYAMHGKDILMGDGNHLTVKGALFVARFINIPVFIPANDHLPENGRQDSSIAIQKRDPFAAGKETWPQ